MGNQRRRRERRVVVRRVRRRVRRVMMGRREATGCDRGQVVSSGGLHGG